MLNQIKIFLFIVALTLLSCGTETMPIETSSPKMKSLFPPTGSINAPVDTALSITMNTWTRKGTGTLGIYYYDTDVLFESLDVADTLVKAIGTALEFKPFKNLDYYTKYYIKIDKGAITDITRNQNLFDGINDKSIWNFTTTRNLPKLRGLQPANMQSNVSVESELTMIFNKSVKTGTGFITLYKPPLIVIERHDVASDNAISIQDSIVTLKLNKKLSLNTKYYVIVDSAAIIDKNNTDNTYAGITDSTGWYFSTAETDDPVVTEFKPANKAQTVAANTPISIKFNKKVNPAVGNIELYEKSINAITFTTSVVSESVITDETGLVAIKLPYNLKFGTSYFIKIDSAAFVDDGGKAFAGIRDSISWSFTTEPKPTSDQNTFYTVMSGEEQGTVIMTGNQYITLTTSDSGAFSIKTVNVKYFQGTSQMYNINITFITDSTQQNTFQFENADGRATISVENLLKKVTYNTGAKGFLNISKNYPDYVIGYFTVTVCEANAAKCVTLTGSQFTVVK
ncbi:MAG: hypothetical protein HW421_2551 [Ignavibacteria bacterium]|nr:hypothetical protein [Ignavibacteria bacterium]